MATKEPIHRIKLSKAVFERWTTEKNRWGMGIGSQNDKFVTFLLDKLHQGEMCHKWTQSVFDTTEKIIQTDPITTFEMMTSPGFPPQRHYRRVTPKDKPETPTYKRLGLAMESPLANTPVKRTPTKRAKRTLFEVEMEEEEELEKEEDGDEMERDADEVEQEALGDELENLDNEGECDDLNFENDFTEDDDKDADYEELIIEYNEPVPQKPKHLTAEEIIREPMCFVFTPFLTSLVQKAFGTKCQYCKSAITYKVHRRATAFIYTWNCCEGSGGKHAKGKWESQPNFHGLYAGNLSLASSIVLSGNQYGKVALLMQHSNVHFFGKDTFFSYQLHFLKPAVDVFWERTQKETFEELSGKELVVAGDGRMDSPGHSAMFCTYTLADTESKKIIAISNKDVRHAEGKSPNMELLAFKGASKEVLELGAQHNVKVLEVVTDAHSAISAELRKEDSCLPGVKHSWDTWHGGKIILKRLNEIGLKSKEHRDLCHWAPLLRNHFWWCSKNCQGQVFTMKSLWLTCLHHVINEHEWHLEIGMFNHCDHEPLTEEQLEKHPWLQANSPTFLKLRSEVMRKYLLKNMGYFTNFRHTGFLESYHSLILMYAPKRIAFGYWGYQIRIKLAAIDHNKHCGRPRAYRQDGQPKDTRAYSKRTKAWYIVPIYEKKKYSYIPELMRIIFEQRENFKGSLKQKVPLDADHPLRIAKTRGMVEARSKEELREKQISRF